MGWTHWVSCVSLGLGSAGAWGQVPLESFVNFEAPPVSPLDLSPSRDLLAVCNTAAARLELFDVSGAAPVHAGSFPVGYDPVSAAFRTESEVWVCNFTSDSVSVVDLTVGAVVHTFDTDNEPADVVFAGTPQRAFVSCSQTSTVLVFDPANRNAAPVRVAMPDDAPRQMDVSPDGNTVYVSIFESGNHNVIGGGIEDRTVLPFPPNAVDSPLSMYSGQNPPRLTEDTIGIFTPPIPGYDDPTWPGYDDPNWEDALDDPLFLPNGLPPAPPTSLTMTGGVNTDHTYTDGNMAFLNGALRGVPWNDLVSGANAAVSGRVAGWEVIDVGVVVLNANTLAIEKTWRNLNSINTALAVDPADGTVAIIGQRVHNYVRFEHSAQGDASEPSFFLREPGFDAAPYTVFDIGRRLNPHYGREANRVSQEDRDASCADPRGLVWDTDGGTLFVTGMGTNNISVVDTNNWPGNTSFESKEPETIDVGEGPTGIVMDAAKGRLYVLNRFSASISVVNKDARTVTATVSFPDPTPSVIKEGRPFLYDAALTGGTGRMSCATCHIDGKSDKMTWDLGDPVGFVRSIGGAPGVFNAGGGLPDIADDLEPFHPVKGPMMTQTLQDIIGKEPHHWRGDRTGIEEFNEAFRALLGDDVLLDGTEMQAFEDFLATLHFPPNPYRNFDNSLPTNLPLPMFKRSGVFGNAGEAMPNGNAQNGLELFRNAASLSHPALTCVTCHTLPTGIGTGATFNGSVWSEIPAGPDGERHHALVSVAGFAQKTFKVPHLRNVYEKVGFDTQTVQSRQGFGFFHDGSVDDLSRLFATGHFTPCDSEQDVADLLAFLMAFSGSGFEPDPTEPPGPDSKDAHAAVGKQVTHTGGATPARVTASLALADEGEVEVVAKWVDNGAERGAVYRGGGSFETDGATPNGPPASILALASASRPMTFTVVPVGSGERLGIDADLDGLKDFDETRDMDPTIPGVQTPLDMRRGDVLGDDLSFAPDGVPDGENDTDGDGESNADEIAAGRTGRDVFGVSADADGSGSVNAVDVQTVINAALGNSGQGVPDINGDGSVNAVDVQLVINGALGIGIY